jgi:hypothetical protein
LAVTSASKRRFTEYTEGWWPGQWQEETAGMNTIRSGHEQYMNSTTNSGYEQRPGEQRT